MKIPSHQQRIRAELDIALYLTNAETETQIALWLRWHGYAFVNF